jgi:RNA polymerase sigma-70 factor, ECF subfamily
VSKTPVSLLQRLKVAGPEDGDWHRLQDLYLPLIRRWLDRAPGLGDEAADLSQQVLMIVAREVPQFERRRDGSFRAWLRMVTANAVRTHRKRPRTVNLDPAEGFLDRLADPNDESAREWDREHDQHVLKKLLAIVRPDFGETTWETFQRFALEGRPAAQVAAELGITQNAVIQAKSRILRRLREEAGELVD